MLDDYPNIVFDQAITAVEYSWESFVSAATSSQSGPTGRPIAMLTFALNHLLGGLNPLGYKITNLLIHLVNSSLIFFLVRRIITVMALSREMRVKTDSATWLAGFCALLWAVHPLNLTAVLYVVQRMTSLSTTFMLIALLSYLSLRQSDASKWPAVTLRILLLAGSAGAAFYTKESALLLPVYALVLEWMVLQFKTSSRKRSAALKAVYLGGALLPVAWLGWHLLQDPHWLGRMYELRPFTLSQRLMTESRALWFYLQQIFVPNPTAMGLHHDDFRVSTSLLVPGTTLLSIAGHAIIISLAWICRQRRPYFTLAAAWFYGGHLLESTIFSLEPVFEHRNYLPILGPILLLTVAVWHLVEKCGGKVQSRVVFLGILALPFMLVTARSAQTSGAIRSRSP